MAPPAFARPDRVGLLGWVRTVRGATEEELVKSTCHLFPLPPQVWPDAVTPGQAVTAAAPEVASDSALGPGLGRLSGVVGELASRR